MDRPTGDTYAVFMSNQCGDGHGRQSQNKAQIFHKL